MTGPCEECGATETVKTFYGRETCEKDDPWRACWECRKPYIMTRLHPEEPYDPAEESASEPDGQASLFDF